MFWHLGASVAGRRLKLTTARTHALESVNKFRHGHSNCLFLGKAALFTGKLRTFHWAAKEVFRKKKRIERRARNYANFP